MSVRSPASRWGTPGRITVAARLIAEGEGWSAVTIRRLAEEIYKPAILHLRREIGRAETGQCQTALAGDERHAERQRFVDQLGQGRHARLAVAKIVRPDDRKAIAAYLLSPR